MVALSRADQRRSWQGSWTGRIDRSRVGPSVVQAAAATALASGMVVHTASADGHCRPFKREDSSVGARVIGITESLVH